MLLSERDDDDGDGDGDGPLSSEQGRDTSEAHSHLVVA